MNDDAELLRAYAKDGSEPAFRELVGRHLPLVQATARRLVAGDTHLAQDVAQTVFTELARKAATLPENVVLGGWLHRHTCFTAIKAVRTEQRRRARERTAMEINAVNEGSARDEHWRQLAPVIDDALNHLSGEDRDAIILRYFEQRDLRAIGAVLGISDDTAQKRIARALEKLRAILTRRGVTVSAVLLATTLDAGATNVPIGMDITSGVAAVALDQAASEMDTSFTLKPLKTMAPIKYTIGAIAAVILFTLSAIHLTHKAQASAKEASTSLKSASPSGPTIAPPKVQAPNLPAVAAAGSSVPADSVLITGNVIAPGAYALPSQGMTVTQAIALAGGLITTPGEQTRAGVYRHQKNGPDVVTNEVDVLQAMRDPTLDVLLHPGDGLAVGVPPPSEINAPVTAADSANAKRYIDNMQQQFGNPISLVANPDGSTTRIYEAPNGNRVTFTQSADGKTNSVTETLGRNRPTAPPSSPAQ